MISWTLIAAVTGTALPIKARPTVDAASWVQSTDIPQPEWNQANALTFELTIDQIGRPIKCNIVVSSGSNAMDGTICASVMKRARFNPARDVSGQAVPTIYRNRIVWKPAESGENYWYDAPDYIATTPELTGKKTKLVNTAVEINENGSVGECFILKSSKNQVLDERACAIVRVPEISTPITDLTGATVRGLRTFFVGFKSGSDESVTMR